MKRCRRCDASKPRADFYVDRRTPDGLRHWCKGCWNAYQRERWSGGRTDRAKKAERDRAWRQANPERQAEIQRNSRIRAKYGIEPAEYAAMHEAQSGVCANPGCNARTSGDQRFDRLVVDHDHVTGEVRGLLCSPCNLVLGQARDDAARLLGLAEYLVQRTDVLASIGASA